MPPKKEMQHLNFADYLSANQPAVDEMKGRILERENQLKDYAVRGRRELKDQAVFNAQNNGDVDYQKTDEFKRYNDTANAYTDYLGDQQTNEGRRMQLMAEYGGANQGDAALLYGMAPRAQTVKPVKWDDYLTGMDMSVQGAKSVWDKGTAARDAAAKAQSTMDASRAKDEQAYQDHLAAQRNAVQNPIGNQYGQTHSLSQADRIRAQQAAEAQQAIGMQQSRARTAVNSVAAKNKRRTL